jgi:penicillin-binding protein 2
MKRGAPQLRLGFIGGLMLLALAGIVLRLWQVQIAEFPKYTKLIASGSRVKVRIPAVRGEIRDRNGIPLVENRMSVDVDFYLPEMVRAYRQQNGYLPLEDDKIRVHGMMRDTKTADIEKIVREIIIPELEKYSLAEDYNTKKLKVHYKNNFEVPFNYRQDIDFESNAVLSERNLALPGLRVEKKPVRYYKYGALGAHFLGYVGMPNNLDKLEDIRQFDFYDPDVEGKAQIELFMNDYLKGTPGVRILQRDVKGVIKQDDVKIVEPKQGANVDLTIDARIQYITEQALRAVGRGAAVVVDPNNGDILAMASVPSYDPNAFIPSIAAKDWVALNKDDTDPLLNRAISAYAPGSTYKIPIGLAGLRAGVGDRSFNCSGGVTYGNKYMRCWIADKGGSHGSLNLPGAIKVSCNAFFYQYGNAAGIDQIVAMGNLLGLGQKSGIPLSGEAPGVLPGPEWLAQISPNERWSSGYTANTSIGQGMVLASPLQMAMVVAAVANGGTSYYPRLIDKVVSQDGKVLLQEPAKVRANLITEGGLTVEQIEKVRLGMKKVVNEGGGTAGKARIKDMEVAGKTGTAQFWRNGKKDNHTWFIAFAPYDKPKYAVCVIVQGAKSGGGVSAPIAAKILEDSFALDREPPAGEEKKPFEIAHLDPAKGSFAHVESVDFHREIPAATAIASDEEVGSSDAPSSSQETRSVAQPNVRDDADEGGRVKNRERKPTGIEKFFNNIFKGGKKKEEKKTSPNTGRR